MKRYTGQKALYEAISRSQAKAKRGSIMDKLRAQPPKEEPVDEPPLLEPTATAPDEAPRPLAAESPEPTVEEQPPAPEPAPVAEKPSVPPVTEAAQPPVAKPEPPVFKPRLVGWPVERIGRPTPPKLVQPLLRPKAVQLHDSRIDVSIPYYIGVAVALTLVLVLLAAFRIGQEYPATPAQAVVPAKPSVRQPLPDAAPTNAGPAQPPMEAATVAPRVVEPTPAPAQLPLLPPAQAQGPTPVQGDHLIVLARSVRSKDFEPVIKYFGEHGIELGVLALNDATRKTFTEYGVNPSVLPSGAGFLLVTKNRYGNPERAGTEGYGVLQKIRELGPLYKPPKDGVSFAPNNFRDAYGMKIR